MEKTEFTYERWVRKHTYGFVFAVFAVFVLNKIFSNLFAFNLNGILDFAVDIVLIVAGWYAYYHYVNRRKLFLCKGYYWVSDDVVHIQTESRTYLLTRIKKVTAVTLSFAFDSKYGHLSIAFEDEELTFVSRSKGSLQTFYGCELAPLLNAILDNNPQLTKNEDSDTWEAKSRAQG